MTLKHVSCWVPFLPNHTPPKYKCPIKVANLCKTRINSKDGEASLLAFAMQEPMLFFGDVDQPHPKD